MIELRRQWMTAPWMASLMGVVIGAAGGLVYWLGAQVWPSSIAVIVSLAATEAGAAQGQLQGQALWWVFAVLVKYSALMALSAASLPFPVPANVALGLIMIAGHASSRALAVSTVKPAAYAELGIALAIGFVPAVLLGMPGLIGLAAAIVARIAFISVARRRRMAAAGLDTATRQLTEACFYLGAVAAWGYV
jgi:cobalamin synthase